MTPIQWILAWKLFLGTRSMLKIQDWWVPLLLLLVFPQLSLHHISVWIPPKSQFFTKLLLRRKGSAHEPGEQLRISREDQGSHPAMQHLPDAHIGTEQWFSWALCKSYPHYNQVITQLRPESLLYQTLEQPHLLFTTASEMQLWNKHYKSRSAAPRWMWCPCSWKSIFHLSCGGLNSHPALSSMVVFLQAHSH